jgi:hypothetical protein
VETSCIKSSTALPFWQLSLADLAPGIPNLRLPELPKDFPVHIMLHIYRINHVHPFPSISLVVSRLNDCIHSDFLLQGFKALY